MPAGVDIVQLCSDDCYDSDSGQCGDSGPSQTRKRFGKYGRQLQNVCVIGTDCSDCGPQSYAVFTTLADAVDVFSNDDGVFEGSLFVHNTTLTSLEGMQSVKSITGNFIIRYNHELTSIAALSNLESIGGSLLFGYNALASLDGLESLSGVGDSFDIFTEFNTYRNWDIAVPSIRVPSLASIGGSLYTWTNATVVDFPRLTDVGSRILHGGSLHTVLYPLLRRAGGFILQNPFAGNIAELDLSSLEYVGPLGMGFEINFVASPSLSGSFDRLELVDGGIVIGGGCTFYPTVSLLFLTFFFFFCSVPYTYDTEKSNGIAD